MKYEREINQCWSGLDENDRITNVAFFQKVFKIPFNHADPTHKRGYNEVRNSLLKKVKNGLAYRSGLKNYFVVKDSNLISYPAYYKIGWVWRKLIGTKVTITDFIKELELTFTGSIKMKKGSVRKSRAVKPTVVCRAYLMSSLRELCKLDYGKLNESGRPLVFSIGKDVPAAVMQKVWEIVSNSHNGKAEIYTSVISQPKEEKQISSDPDEYVSMKKSLFDEMKELLHLNRERISTLEKEISSSKEQISNLLEEKSKLIASVSDLRKSTPIIDRSVLDEFK